MKVFIFAIGGTGARALRALSFCLASSMYKVNKDLEIVPMIIDYDATNGDKTRAVEALKDYMELHNAAYEQNDIAINADYRSFFMPRVSYLKDVSTRNGNPTTDIDNTFEFTFNGSTSSSKGTFAQYLNVNALTGEKMITADLLRALYNDAEITDPDYAYTELNLDMEKGFKGNPNIGTVVFDKIAASPEFDVFAKNFDPHCDRAFIVGSIFGGTGSSGIPQMINAIRSHNVTGFRDCKIGAAIVMPYFKVDTPKKGGAINSNIFKSKQKAALGYYDLMQHEFNLSATYYVADQDNLQTVLKYSEGDDSQRNNAHIVEMLMALSVLDFAIRPENQLDGGTYEFGLKSDFGGRQDPLQMKNFGANTKEQVLKPLAYLAIASKYYKDYLITENRDNSLAYFSKLQLANKVLGGSYATFTSFIQRFFKWLDEMNQQEHPFYPFVTDANNLDKLVKGYKDDSGLISDDADYKGFNAKCNEFYKTFSDDSKNDSKKYPGFQSNSDINKNEYQLFFKLMYETAIVIFKKLKEK